jgi:hypothetical protein
MLNPSAGPRPRKTARRYPASDDANARRRHPHDSDNVRRRTWNWILILHFSAQNPAIMDFRKDIKKANFLMIES